MVLYHCCVSLDRANEITSRGFDPDELVHVSEEPPLQGRRTATQTHAVVYLGPPFGFSTAEFPTATNEHNERGWLVPGALLNGFPRAIWPQS